MIPVELPNDSVPTLAPFINGSQWLQGGILSMDRGSLTNDVEAR